MSVTAEIGAMWSAIRRASSCTTLRAISSPARAAAKIPRASYGGCNVVLAPFSETSRSASAEIADAHGSISSSRPAATRSTSPAAP